MPVLLRPPVSIRPPAPMVRAPANYIRPFRAGGGAGNGGGGGGSSGGSGGGGGWNGWGPWPGNPWWGNPSDSTAAQIVAWLLFTSNAVGWQAAWDNNRKWWEEVRPQVRARAGQLDGLWLDAPATQQRLNSGGFAFIDPTGIGGSTSVEGALLTGGIKIAEALALTAAGLGWIGAQLWGYLNNRPETAEQNWYGPDIEGVLPDAVIYGPGTGTGTMSPVVGNPEIWGNLVITPVPDNVDVSTWWFWRKPVFGNPYGWTYNYGYKRPSDGQFVQNCIEAGILGECAVDTRNETEPPLMLIEGWEVQGGTEYLPEVAPITAPVLVPFPDAEPITPGTEPEVEVLPEPLPTLVPTITPVPVPGLTPGITPGPGRIPAQPAVVPSTPSPIAPPAPPDIDGAQQISDEGKLLPPPKRPVAITPPDYTFPVSGGKPITGMGPAPTPVEMAKELGRIEQKLEHVMRGDDSFLGNKWNLLWSFIEFVMAAGSGGTYVLREACGTDPGSTPREIEVPFDGGLTQFGALMNRLDALAELQQAAKELKQPTCRKSDYQGDIVSVDFQSDEISPGGKMPLRKLFRYRDQNAVPFADHVSHWDGFVWQAGAAVVIHKGASWGVLQVWALDFEEGKRVIRHAGAIAGVDPDTEGQWQLTGTTDPRYGQTGTMRLHRRKSWKGQFLQISKRDGPSGSPIVPFDSV